MGLISAKDFLNGNIPPSSSGSVTPKGLMSAQDFKANLRNKPTDEEMSQVYNPGHENDIPFTSSDASDQNQMAHQWDNNPDAQAIINQPAHIQPQKDIPWLAKVQSAIYDNTLKPVEDFLGRASSSAVDTLSLGQSRKFQNNNPAPPFIPQEVQDWSKPATNTSEKAADIVGNLYGFSAMAPNLYATGGRAALAGLAKVAPNAGNIAQMLVRGAGAGALYGTASEGLDAAISPNDRTIGQRLGNVGSDAAVFAGGDAAFGLLGAGLQKLAGTKLGDAVNGFFGRGKTIETPTIQPDQPILGLPEPRSAILAREAQQKSILPSNTEPIFGQGNIFKPEPIGLPEPQLASPTMARMSAPINSSKGLYEQLTNEVNSRIASGDIKPVDTQGYTNLQNAIQEGYKNGEISHEESIQMQNMANQELQNQRDLFNEHVQNTYSQIAPKEAPPLEQLMTEAYQNKKPISSDLLQRAKDQQSLRNVAGLDLPVKSIDQRYTEANNGNRLGVTGNAAIPETKIGFTKPSLLDMANKPIDSIGGKSLNANTTNPGLIPRNVKTLPPIDKALNVDAKLPQPIKLTDKQATKNARADNFARVEDNPTLPNTASQIQSKTIKEKTSLGQKLDQAYINTIDNVYSLSKFDKSAKDVNGGTLNPSDSAYKLALNSRNADMQARQILEHNMIDSQGNVTGDSLKSIAKQISAKDLPAFEDYQVAKHAPTRMARGEKVYKDNLDMTIQKAKMIADNYEKSNPEFKTVNDQYHNFDNQLGQNWLVDTGMLKQDQWNGYREANPNYTPNNRIFSDLEKNSKFGSKGGFTDQSQPIKTADGSQRPIVSPLESRIEHVATYVKTAKQNEVGQAVVRSLQANPEALKGFAEIVHDQPHVDVNEILQKNGPEGLMDHIAQTIESAKQKPDLTKGNIVNVLMNGEVVHLRITDPQFLEAVGNLSPQAQPKWIEAVGKVTHVMKTTTTGVNPIFGLTKNIWKDIPHAYVASKSTNNPFVFGKDILSALADVVGNKESYQAYKNMGGGHSSSLSADRNLLAQSKEKLVPSSGIGQTLKRNLLTKPYHMLENFNNAIETAPRLAEYNRIVKQGGGTYDAKVEGLHQANDLTTNFNKRGNYVKQLDNLVPYLNASVQGLDQFARMFKTNPVATSVKAVMAISVPTAILYAVNHDDPNYQQMSNYIKDNNFLIPKGDGTFFKIPKPRELGMLFSSSIERVMRQHFNDDPKAFQDFANNLIQNFSPPGVGGAISGIKDNGITGAPLGAMRDSIAGPMINMGLNKDFVNRPIVPKDLASLSPKLQFDPRTSEPAKFLGNLINASPKQLDYLAKSYLGGIASLGIPASTQGNGGNFLSRIGNTLKQQVTADPLYSNDIQSNFYNEKAKQDQAKADFKATGTQQQQDLSAYYDRISSSLAPLRKQEKMIQKDNSLSSSEKQAKLRDIQTTMNSLLQRGLIK